MDQHKIVITLAATVVGCSVASLYWYHSQKKEFLPEGTKVADLLPVEQALAGGAGGDNAIANLTWFCGDPNTAISILQKRNETIMKENPWLAGRAKKHKGKYALVYPDVIVNSNEYFAVIQDAMSREKPLNELAGKLGSYFLKTGPKEPLWNVSIFPSTTSSGTYFAVMVSMSHVIGDGETYYKLQNMLLEQSIPVETLEVTRIHTSPEQQIQAVGGKEEYEYLHSAGFVVSCIAGVLRAVWNKRYSATSRIYMIDPGGVEEAKRKAVENQEEVEFVSTNDVLTSWFLQNCNCKHGVMALNFRGRLEGHTERHAGNYENIIFYRTSDSASPVLIRKSISTDLYQRQVTAHQPMPSFWESATSTTAICTTWASFARPCLLKGCQEEVQIPLINVAASWPSNLALCVIFRAGPRGLAVLLNGSIDKMQGLEKQVPFLNQQKVIV